MPDSDNTKDLQERLNKARLEFQAALERHKGLERNNKLLTLAIIVVVLGFLMGGWYTMKANFAPEKIQQSLVSRGPEVMTQVFDAVAEGASEVLPVYFEQVQTKSVEAMPEAAVVLDREINELSKSATEKVLAQLDEALKQVHATQEANIRKTFPDLTQEQAQKVVNEMMGTVEEEVEGLTGYILAKTVGDIDKLDKSLKAFDTKDLPNDEAQLSRLMMHHLLMYLDAELMEIKLEAPPKPAKAGTPAKGGK